MNEKSFFEKLKENAGCLAMAVIFAVITFIVANL